MDNKQRICKICNRRFANGKAMGGHMRSHLAKLPVPAKPDTPPVVESSSSLSLHSDKDHMQTAGRSVAVSESETESPRSSNPTKRRSKRRRRAAVLMMEVVATPPARPPAMVVPEPDSVSAVTQNFSVEEVALCLMKLSKDKWPSKGKQVVEYVEEEDDDEEENEEEDEEEEKEEDDEEDGLFCVTGGGATGAGCGATGVGGGFKTTNKKIFKCEKCNKCFPSYQSLGGHKASHKKIKYVNLNSGFEEDSPTTAFGAIGVGGGASSSQQKIQKNFECPFCDKVFESGQALGGHKKVHFSYLSVGPKTPAKSCENFTIDLNQPAPEEDSEVSVV